ncbi:RHS repeat-associated core domain-containing protein [Catellatospora paridis]|uniref:RHS repeat-associated core domain-containing protein n=1 Tax=Catellatospora paridis TaxID=1617086 RepID=UPI0038B277B5
MGSEESRWSPVAVIATALTVSLLTAAPAYAKPSAPPQAPQAVKLDKDGGPVTGKAWTQQRVKDTALPKPVWPTPGKGRVDLPAAGARTAADDRGVKAGDLPVWVRRGKDKSGERLTGVEVQVVDRAGLPEALRDGMVLRVKAAAGAASGAASVSVDYSAFRYAAGGDWASRLRLWQVPDCALTTPQSPACRPVQLRTDNDVAAGVATAEVTASVAPTSGSGVTRGQLAGDVPMSAGAGMMVALAAGASGDGDYGATGLAPSSTWSSGSSSGEFTWNYPLRMPPGGSPAPSVALSYSSSAVDGRSDVTNNQPSWIGEGFEYGAGYIERRYVPCAEDKKNSPNNSVSTGDQCWRSENATMSLNGRGGELIFQTGKGWHVRGEDGSKIEKLTGASNGDAGDPAYGDVGEYWKVTTTDGTQYFFGLDDLPGQSTATNSVLTVPVYGNHTGEPCRKSTYAGSDCVQAWRWNLDYVVDVRGNTMSYWYGKETNKYARNNTPSDPVTYDRAGYLKRIDYGTYDRTLAVHGVTERSVTPYAQVVFETDMRCFSNCGTESAPVKASWKDTPWDQECKGSTCTTQYSPTFWTTKRLKSVLTKVWDTTVTPAKWQDVESWTLTHTFTPTADSTHTGLWLDKIDHSGLVGTPVAMPPVTFEAVSLPNRVLTDHTSTDNWLRVNSVVTESGARIKVDYSLPECTAAIVATLQPHNNNRRCYPTLVPDPDDPSGDSLIPEWWHKYRVDHVVENDIQLVDGHQSVPKHTWYEYVGDPAWHYADDDGLSKPDRKTWAQWRGYGEVRTRLGSDPATQTLAVTKFLRGMHGDRLAPSGGTRTVVSTAAVGPNVNDEDQFAGQVREQVVYNGTLDKPVNRTVNVPWRSDPTASRTINGDVAEARYVNTTTTYSSTALGVNGARGWRTSSGTRDLDHTYGMVNWAQDDGDIAVSGDEKCTTYTYNRNTDKNIVGTIKKTTVKALPCATPVTTADQMVSDQRLYYDGGNTTGSVPKYGAVTKVEQLQDWVSGTGTVFQVTSQSTYDFAGRPKTSTDIKGNVTTTDYTPAVGGPITKVTSTGPAPTSWTSSAESNPYWGSTVKATDQNNRVTAEIEYDALGRTTKVWQLGWSKTDHPTQPGAEFAYSFAPNRDAYPYVTSKTLNADGNQIVSFQIFDGLLRERQSQSTALDGSGARLVSDTIYDELGASTTSYAAHAEPGAPSGTLWWEPEWSVPTVTKTEYDRATRPTASVLLAGDGVVNLVEKWRTVTSYEGDLAQVTPPNGGIPTTTVTDVEGRTVAVRQHTTPAGVGGAYQETRYEFNAKGQLVKTIDPAGNEWKSEYDILGRLWRSTDPDKGVNSSTFGVAGELVSTTDANGEVLWFGYDALGRKKEVRDDSATGALRTEFKYDTLYSGQSGFKGQLTQSIRYEPPGSANAYKWQVRGFNDRYLPTGVNYVIPAVETGLDQTYVYAYEYSAATGAPASMTYPSAGGLVTEKVTTDFDDVTGLPSKLNTDLTGFAGTMATASYTAYGETSGTIYKMPGGVYAQQLNVRDEATRRVTQSKVLTETGTGTVADRRYTYDHAGNVTSIADLPQVGQADTQCFRYDALARLKSAWTPKSGVDCQPDPVVADLGGPEPYWKDWTFDAAHNRLTETGHAGAGDTVRTYTVPNGGQNVVRPHVANAMTTTSPGASAVASNYAYDNAGNTVCRPTGSATNDCATKANSQTLVWDAEGELASVKVGTQTVESNVYDADGTRLIRRDSAGTTLYLPGQEIRREGTVTTGTRYYTFDGAMCASRKNSSATADLTWLYSDHQLTQQVSINAATQAVTVRRQDPYGGNRPGSSSPAWANGKGFVGGDKDPTGLVNIGARQYDPVLGRFITADPVMDMADPHHFNAYSYGFNSPVTKSDPTGMDPCPGGGGGCYYDGTTTSRDGVTPEQMTRARQASAALVPLVAEQQRKIQEAERKKRECEASFWCRNAGWVGAAAGIVAGVVAGAGCGLLLGPVGAAACGGFVGGVVGSLVTNSLDADEESGWQMFGEALGAGLVGAALGAGAAVIGAAAFGAGVALSAGMGLKAAGQMAVASVRSSVAAVGGGAGGLRNLLKPGGAKPAGGGAKPPCHSFDPQTPVLMADGSTKPIKNVKIGDEVKATDPETGETASKQVTWLHINQDADLTDVTVRNEKTGQTQTLHTTWHHPFWNVGSNRWDDAMDLAPGVLLRDVDGLVAQRVVSVKSWVGQQEMRDLTVFGIHTYYVIANESPILVHNCDPVAANGASLENLSLVDIGKIQATADRINRVIHVVGSRTTGKLKPDSDWDYVVSNATSKIKDKIKWMAPRGPRINGSNGLDIIENLNDTLPHITFFPKGMCGCGG